MILIGVVSLVFKYLALIMIVLLVVLLFIAMIPGCEQVLGNAGKKIMQFVFLGGLGLFFVCAFLFVNGLIEAAVGGMTKFYFWTAILQGLIWFVIFKLRHMIGTVFVKGTLSAQELARKAQSGFERFQVSPVSSLGNRFLPNRTVRYSENEAAESLVGSSESTPSSVTPIRTLFRAGKKAGLKAHDRLRYGEEGTIDRQLAEERRQEFKQLLADKKAAARHVLTVPKAERFRSKVHDLAGDQNTPVQETFKKREQARLERLKRQDRRDERKEAFQQFRKEKGTQIEEQSLHPDIAKWLSTPKIKRAFQKEQKDIPSEDSAISKELFEKGEK